MKAVFGLGNPGDEYRGTRHNAGFEVADELIRRKGWGEEREKRSTFGGQTVRYRYALKGGLTVAVKPLTFMNASGSAFTAALKDFGIEAADALVIADDVSLPLGKLRLRPGGSSGGQKGLEDVLNMSGTDQIARLRFGVGARLQDEKPSGEKLPADLAGYVLAKFDKDEQKILAESIARAADAAELWTERGIEAAMNRFNGIES